MSAMHSGEGTLKKAHEYDFDVVREYLEQGGDPDRKCSINRQKLQTKCFKRPSECRKKSGKNAGNAWSRICFGSWTGLKSMYETRTISIVFHQFCQPVQILATHLK